MGTTAGGLPWPEGSDLVRDGDNAIRALAEAIEAKMWTSGTYPKFRFQNGMYTTGTDGRVWIPITGMTNVTGAVAAILGTARWAVRPYSVSGGSVLFEVTDYPGNNVIASTAMTFVITAWGLS